MRAFRQLRAAASRLKHYENLKAIPLCSVLQEGLPHSPLPPHTLQLGPLVPWAGLASKERGPWLPVQQNVGWAGAEEGRAEVGPCPRPFQPDLLPVGTALGFDFFTSNQ